ncbi:hypothetical protein IFM61606_02661 [Aspergillus udagawae]|uniref:CENP-V/GFA domain-containing protein n=1 Tax=Aspergillus udagawae TaxID=91492 RepID=A0ABQ1ARC0_9EURO|nr:hypothetical protein IFM51744_06396 [Aspergillus udagawae]GFF86672.1 hypothetical protein IFM53868_04887 [Aspergillus udagawae]GFG07593.1 hypothetical protein IFM5058_03498 [Aspergillus udagawae]GFG22794.1 hypothetical protein IFM61606_02661 [Aspergillus udagawae]
MSTHAPLRGSCLCGRNQYSIDIPDNVIDHAHIYFDSSRDQRKSYGSPLTAWLRVPLSWYQSHTESYFPDETHATIRRVFTPHHAPHTQRIFCGYCGTPLTYWSEIPREEADYMSVTIGSLYGEAQRMLEDLDILPGSSDEGELEEEEAGEAEEKEEKMGVTVSPAEHTQTSSAHSTVVVPSRAGAPAPTRSYRRGTTRGIPWFEEMIEGSRLGRIMKTRRGVGVSDDSSTTIEWEVTEWVDEVPSEGTQAGSEDARSAVKRKRGHYVDTEGPGSAAKQM